MDVLIPLINGKGFYELRYALRSFEKWLNPERVLIVGGKPDWYTGEHLPHKDYEVMFKEKNIFDKTVAGAELLDGDFYFCNDDHFLLAPYQGLHHKGRMIDNLRIRNKNGSYGRMMQNTIDVFGDVMNYDTHCPMVMNRGGLKAINLKWTVHHGYCFKTSYCASNNITGVFHEDHKFNTIPKTLNVPYFSTTESCNNLSVLPRLFPTKSKYEI
jgi:hypothetical protein